VNKTMSTVLVADDDSTTRSVLSKILENNGYKVLLADRGEKCLFLALEKNIDAFLVDINMPGLSGIEICSRLRSIDRYKMTPIIFITSRDDTSLLNEAFEVGATDFLIKPANHIVLTARLRSHLQKIEYFRAMEQVRIYSNRYISPRTQKIIEAYSTTGFRPSPELHDVCIMFTDIRGYTSLSHDIPLDTLFTRLSSHLGMQVDKVHKFGGYIDKFGGDGLMALFDCDNMIMQACLCALEIIDTSKDVIRTENDQELPVGIGIHYGEVMTGNIGSAEHLDYSAIGESVNIAARLCGAAEPMQINISEQVFCHVNTDPVLAISQPTKIKLKGLHGPVPVYKLSKNISESMGKIQAS
jgi:adenylate cyclase